MFSACRKQNEEVKPAVELNAQNISNLKTWYKAQVKPIQEKSAGAVIFDPQWGEGKLHQLNDGTKLAVFPVWRELAVQYFEAGFVRRLVIHLSATDEVISGKIMEMVSSKEYLRENKEEIPIKFYEGTHQQIEALVWESEVLNDDLSYKSQGPSCTSTTSIDINHVSCTATVTTTRTCSGGQHITVVEIQDTDFCSSGGGGGSSGGTTPPPIGWIPPDGGGGGGSSGGIPVSGPCQGVSIEGVPCSPTDTGENINPTNLSLENSFLSNERAVKIYAKILQNAALQNLLTDFSNPNLNYNLSIGLEPIFIQSSDPNNIPMIPKPDIGGATDAVNKDYSSGQIRIVINSSNFANKSEVQIAKAIIHELIHAHILAAIAKAGGIAGLANLPVLNTYYQKTKKYVTGKIDHNKAQHNFMADVYFDTLAEITQNFDNSRFPIAYYRALAWEGLEDANVYMKNVALSPQFENDIEALRNQLKAHSLLNPLFD